MKRLHLLYATIATTTRVGRARDRGHVVAVVFLLGVTLGMALVLAARLI
jgi:hypothetical protein